MNAVHGDQREQLLGEIAPRRAIIGKCSGVAAAGRVELPPRAAASQPSSPTFNPSANDAGNLFSINRREWHPR